MIWLDVETSEEVVVVGGGWGGGIARGEATLYLAKINVCVSVERSQKKMPLGSLAVSRLPSLVLSVTLSCELLLILPFSSVLPLLCFF